MIPRSFALTALLLAPVAIPQGRGAAPSDRARGGVEQAGELVGVYFDAADWDSDGWIDFGEAERSLDVDRGGFAVYDTDRDGLVSRAEFTVRYRAVIGRGGVFPAPRPKPEPARTGKLTTKDLVERYDLDHDGKLSELEVARAQADATVKDPEAAALVRTLDADRSGALEANEIDALLAVLHPERRSERARRARSLADLFDHVEPSRAGGDATIAPPRIRGPVSVFRRLDFDRNGKVGLEDLVELQRPLQSPVRAPAVLATLDADGDGYLTRAELLASMRTGTPLGAE